MDERLGVYKAINRVQAALAKEGITKSRHNQQQNYQFRGIDDVYNVVSPLLADNQLCILPRIIKRECVERLSANKNPLFYVTVEAEFDFVSAEDGSIHTCRTFGEAMDSGDKATNKAMSAAYKYACFQAFAIPTEGDNDADATTHKLAENYDQRPQHQAPPEHGSGSGKKLISEGQVKRFHAICFAQKIPEKVRRDKLLEHRFSSSADITRDKYEEICAWAQTYDDDIPF